MKKMFIPVLALLGMVACTNENEPEIEISNNEPVEIKFNESILNIESATRAINNNAALNVDEEIGVSAWLRTAAETPANTSGAAYTNLANAKYTKITDGLQAETGKTAYFPMDKEQYLDFYAYFPYSNALTNNVATYNLADQHDIMWANNLTKQNKESTNMSFAFNHKLSAITIKVKLAAATNETLNLSAIKIKSIKPNATLNITTGVITSTGTPAEQALTVTAQNLTTTPIEFITDYLIWPETTPTFIITIGGKDYEAAATKAVIANHKTVYTFNVTATSVNLAKESIIGWESTPDEDGGDIS